MRTAIQLYTVRELDEPAGAILDRVAEAGYDGVQLAGLLRDATLAELATMLDDRGLEVAPSHVGIGDLEDDLPATLEAHRDTIGATGAVISSLEESQFESRDAVERTADRLSGLAADLDGEGWELHYHNHDHEFVDLGGETAFEALVRESDGLCIELDVGWALVGGTDPVAFIEEYGDRIDLLHMKDMDVDAGPRGEFAEIGEGDVDMAGCVAAGEAAGVEWLIYEHDDPDDPAASIDAGATFLEDL